MPTGANWQNQVAEPTLQGATFDSPINPSRYPASQYYPVLDSSVRHPALAVHIKSNFQDPSLSLASPFSSSNLNMSSSRKRVIIVGSGWAGATLSTSLDENKYSITLISPETTTPYTPLLASAACGHYDFNIVETPVRHTSKHFKFIKARVGDIDFKSKTVKCIPEFEDLADKEFILSYDIVVIAPGVSFKREILHFFLFCRYFMRLKHLTEYQ
jgi:hypothetical protein